MLKDTTTSPTRVNGTGDATAVHELSPAVETAQLIVEIKKYVRRYVVLNDYQLTAVALWVLHTHAVGASEQTPYLHVRSPEKGSAKTRLLETLEPICRRAVRWELPSEAVAYRAVTELNYPTMLLDEVDAIFGTKKAAEKHDGLRGLINSGNRRGASVPRYNMNLNSIELFETFCPKALAGIGRLPDTVEDRSVPIVMKKRKRSEEIERWRAKRVKREAAPIHERCEAWAQRHLAALNPDPDLPDELSDRQQDATEPLFAIADLAGEEWGAYARAALTSILVQEEGDESSLRLRLLADTRRVLLDAAPEEAWEAGGWVKSGDLLGALLAVEDAPWDDDGYKLTYSKLAWFLKHYEIKPGKQRLEDEVTRAYSYAELKDAWDRYLPPRSAE